ncbi:MAG: S1C family serine protease [Verrucomicrobiota bacterium]
MSRRSAFSLRFALLSAALCLLVAAPVKTSAGTVADSLSEEVRAAFEHSRNAVVKIEASDKDGQLCGTGFFIDPNGVLLTSYSVGGESRDIVVSQGDNKFPAQRLIADCRSGIAILQIKNLGHATAFLPLAKSTDLNVASPVLSVTYPMDMPITPNFGMIAGFDLKYLGRYFVITHIRASVPVQRGAGGAPLLNMRGEAVGIVISSLDGGASCFAVPIEAAEKIHRDYVRFGATKPGRIGVVVREAGAAIQGSIAEIESFETDAPALKAGLQKGDIVLRIGQNPVKAPEDVLNAGFYLTAGDPVPVAVWRGDKEVDLQVEPAGVATPCRGMQQPPVSISSGDITLRLP